MEEKLVNYFIEKYNPLAVILHGSRVVGKEREYSDWDFVFILREPNDSLRRSIVFGQNCEAKKLIFPVSDEIIKEQSWSLRDGNTKVLFDTEDIGKTIISKAQNFASEPTHWSEKDTIAWAAFFKGRVDNMRDYQDESVAFQIKIGDMYKKSIALWFDIHKKQQGAPQVYDSLPIIKSEDPEFYTQLEIIASNSLPKEKVSAAEKIYINLFGEK